MNRRSRGRKRSASRPGRSDSSLGGALRVAIDLGAGSGRAMLGRLGEDGLLLREVHRFRYEPLERDGHLRWDLDLVLEGVAQGLAAAAAAARDLGGRVHSMGVDSWAVDYALFDAEGALCEQPVCYRDARAEVMEDVFRLVPRDEIFARTGIQLLPFNTVFQLFARVREGLPAAATRLLMIPDALHFRLTGVPAGERTNASTTQLLNAVTGDWDGDLFRRLRLPLALMPEVRAAGTRLGPLLPSLQEELGLAGTAVIAPATHDTGSAVAGTPLREGWAYISSGTWSLVGVELPAPLITPAVAAANFTNEAGAFGTTRFLKNVMGLWILESCRKEWPPRPYDELLADVARVPSPVGRIDPDHPRFFNPPSMVREVAGALAEAGHAVPSDPVRLAKVVLDSLAARYAEVVRAIESLTGRRVEGIHVVGGGSRNTYLNQATADAAGRPVRAGPVEATTAGNLAVQAVADGEVASLAEGRRRIAAGAEIRAYEPGRRSA
ncbi:MAG TPA: rhamnulokinase family protein [Vicinamibacteria bacterium]|nr:rhamnulokinase family protein [Vicinamibacteria bacterium]